MYPSLGRREGPYQEPTDTVVAHGPDKIAVFAIRPVRHDIGGYGGSSPRERTAVGSNDRVSVVVTGLGATTPLGGDVVSPWSAMLAGTSGVRRLTEPWVDKLPVKIAAPAVADPV